VPWVAVENSSGREMATKWMKAKEELVATSGWQTYTELVSTKEDDELDLAEIEDLMAKTVKGIGGAKNRVKKTMNGFVIAVGIYVKPLSKKALASAQELGTVAVDVGDTACRVPVAAAEIQKAAATGKVGKKKKTIRC